MPDTEVGVHDTQGMPSHETAPIAPPTNEPRPVLMAPVERLIFFSDAAVAIAITLLILPLMDGVADAAKQHLNTADYLKDNAAALGAFALSFVLIARFWRSHHRLFTDVEREVPGLFWLNMAWLLAVVFLPVATASTGALPTDHVQLAMYIGTMVVIAGLLTAMTVLLRQHPEAWTDGSSVPVERVYSGLALTVMLAVALVLALTVPGLNYWAMLVLLLSRPARVILQAITRIPIHKA